MAVDRQTLPRHEAIRRQRWLGLGAILAAIPVSFIGWLLLIRVAGGGIGVWLLGGLFAILTSGLLLTGLILLAGTDGRWSAQQAVAVYAIVGLIVWWVTAGVERVGTVPGELTAGLLIAALWPAWVLVVFYAQVLGLVAPGV